MATGANSRVPMNFVTYIMKKLYVPFVKNTDVYRTVKKSQSVDISFVRIACVKV